MAGSVNKVTLLGNLGKDPEVKTFSNGGKVCNVTVATSETWKDKASGEKKERTEWHNVVIRNEALIDVASRFLRKGSKVYLEGSIQTRKYQDNNGADRYITEVVVPPFSGVLVLLDPPPTAGQGRREPQQEQTRQTPSRPAGRQLPPEGGTTRVLDDEIPFAPW